MLFEQRELVGVAQEVLPCPGSEVRVRYDERAHSRSSPPGFLDPREGDHARRQRIREGEPPALGIECREDEHRRSVGGVDGGSGEDAATSLAAPEHGGLEEVARTESPGEHPCAPVDLAPRGQIAQQCSRRHQQRRPVEHPDAGQAAQ